MTVADAGLAQFNVVVAGSGSGAARFSHRIDRGVRALDEPARRSRVLACVDATSIRARPGLSDAPVETVGAVTLHSHV